MRLKLLAAAALGAAITVPACALAAQYVEPVVNLPTSGPTQVPWTSNFNIPLFNSSLGTLNEVEFYLTDTTSIAVQITNTTGVAQNFTNALASIPLMLTGPGLGPSGLVATVSTSLANGSANPGTTDFTAVTNTQNVSWNTTTGLSLFETGPLPVSYIANAGAGSYSGSANGGVDFGGVADVTGTFDVIYDYTPTPGVPEPATWAFMMLGVGAIGAAMRGRRKAGLALAAV
jgi:hypothetical protein